MASDAEDAGIPLNSQKEKEDYQKDAGTGKNSRDGKGSFSKSRRRLMITKMVMENFKSYAGVQEVGPFHKCFSSVVGPNGSGKSNVIDAMLFVFGKRAKQLRLNKVSELIHNSSNHQNLDYAQVSVYFQEIEDVNDEDYNIIPGTDMVVTRVAYRNNTSKYIVNDRTSNFTDVTNLLKTKGIDLDNNRFLILQGEVEQIAMMKPKGQDKNDVGLLEYLEDIIGSHVHVEKIEEGAKQLEELNEKRGGMVHRVKLVEKEKDSLETAKQEAEAYMLGEAELMTWKCRVVEMSKKEASSSAEGLKAEVGTIEAKVKEEKLKYAEHQKELEELKAVYKQCLKEHEGLENQLEETKKEFAAFERKDIMYQEDLKHMKQKLKKLDEKKAKAEKALADTEKATVEAHETVPILEAKVAKTAEDISVQEKELEKIQDAIKGEIEAYGREMTAVHAELAPWEVQLNDARARVSIADSEKRLLVEKHAAAAKHLEDAHKSVQDMEAKLMSKEKELKSMRDAVRQRKASLAETREEEKVSAAQEGELEARVQAARQKVNEMRAASDSAKTQSGRMKAILEAKESGRIPGILGRLGDLGAIDAKYDVAVSSSVGALDNIVVETVEDAQACIELMRTRNLGVATFIILDKIRHVEPQMNERVRTPENVPRLFDLIRVRDQRLKLAFFFAARNTVVANDLEQGTRIAYGPDRRFKKVVTLSGEVFEGSGTMTGGGGKPRGGRMGTAVVESGVSREVLAQAEQELRELSGQLEALQTRLATLSTTAGKDEKAIATLVEVTIPKTEMEIEALKANHTDLAKRIADLRAAANPSKDELNRVKELEASKVKEQKHIQKLERDSAHLHKKVEDLQKQIDGAGGEELTKAKASLEKLQQSMDADSTEISRKKVLIASNEKAVKKLEKAIQDGVQEKEKLTEQLEKLKGDFKELENDAFASQESHQQTLAALEVKKQELRERQAAYKTLDDIDAKHRSAEVDMMNKLEDKQGELRLWLDRHKGYEKKLADLIKEQKRQLSQLEDDGLETADIQAMMEKLNALPDGTKAAAQDQVALLEAKLKEMKPNLASVAEYRKKAAEYNERVQELDSVTNERDEVRKNYDELRKRRLDEFMAGFNVITLKLKEMYQMITLGGDAELELVDSLDPFSEGIVFSVRPPKKSWKNICNLSGGEKTLSSLALVFALHHYKPTPLYVMDEIDAALDFKNVSIVAHYIKDRTKNAQFIIISLRNNMFELADRLVGIYKTDNCTKSITIDPRSFSVAAAAH